MCQRMTFILCCFVWAMETTQIVGQTHENAKALTDYLFLDYDKRIRPTRNQSIPTEVLVDFTLLTINDLDEVTETMKVTGYLTVSWVDEYLVWDPDLYGGLQYYLWPQSTIWKPDVSLGNSIFDYKELGIDTLNVEVSNDGTVLWTPFEVFRSTCSFDITNFPFDVQICYLYFMAWSYTESEVTMNGGLTGIDLTEYSASSTWDLIDTSWSTERHNGESSMKYTFTAKRKPLFFILTVFMPIILLAFLNLFVFALPCESGERAGFSVTVFLSLAVFLTIVSDNLPKNSDQVSVFAIYMVILTIQGTLIIIIAMITIRWSYNDENKPIPRYMLTIAHVVTFNRQSKVAVNTVNKKQNGNEKEKQVHKFEKHIDIKDGYGSTPIVKFQDAEGESQMDSDPVEDKYRHFTWVEVVRALDVVFFILFFIIFCLTTAVCFFISILSSKRKCALLKSEYL